MADGIDPVAQQPKALEQPEVAQQPALEQPEVAHLVADMIEVALDMIDPVADVDRIDPVAQQPKALDQIDVADVDRIGPEALEQLVALELDNRQQIRLGRSPCPGADGPWKV
ncbi:MAG: hypothetical protein OXG30_00405 [bacterium]|nr:hypothetical protein [bacterium]